MNLNENAWKIAEEMIERKEELNIAVVKLENKAMVISAGIKTAGSFEAGLLLAKLCMGGLGKAELELRDFGGMTLPCVKVTTSSPKIACMESQKAGWKIKLKDFFALGSGPAQLLKNKKEKSKSGVIFLECSEMPGEDVAEHIAEKCGIDAKNLIIACASTNSISGATQISARAIETALFKMDNLKLDANAISAAGIAPISPVVGDAAKMMGSTNDMIIYGSTVFLVAECCEDALKRINEVPSRSSKHYGKPFAELFENAGRDFYKIDPLLFAPAEVIINDTKAKKLKKAGKINHQLLKKSLGA